MDEAVSEELLDDLVGVLVRLVEAAGALVIFAGALGAFVRLVRGSVRGPRPDSFVPIRLDLGRFPALRTVAARGEHLR